MKKNKKFESNKSSEREDINNFCKKIISKIFTKKNLIYFIVPFIILYLFNINYTILKLKRKIKEIELELQLNNEIMLKSFKNIKKLEIEIKKINSKKKIGIALVYPHLYFNGISRSIATLADLLYKRGEYEIYIITKTSSYYDYKYNKNIKRVILEDNYQYIKNFDDINNIQIYIVNNDISTIDMYHSFGKKVIGIYHGVYLSCIFNNETTIYSSYKYFSKFDSFVHIIPDDYWVYKKLGFNNTIYIPRVNAFENNISSSQLIYKNLLLVGRIDDIIKGAKYCLLAMAEIIKEVPDAKLTIIGSKPPENLKNLMKKLKIENNVEYFEFSTNITEFYLNTSVLLVSSISEGYPMIINEGKAHGLPIVAFDIDYSPVYKNGVITVEMFDYKSMAKEAIKLLNSYKYRKRKGEEAKLSLLKEVSNEEIVDIWNNLFHSLLSGPEDYKDLQEEIEKKYYNEELAKKHLEKHFHYAQKFNKYFKCHSFDNITSLKYINNIKACEIYNS